MFAHATYAKRRAAVLLRLSTIKMQQIHTLTPEIPWMSADSAGTIYSHKGAP